ncbi:MAG: ATP synthase F0 subunit C [Candidatus Margulisbacteria bacterium GWF2_35_9]|nr:MAG: ATP synthase F0 subunit C [Candidatus Margulisbacteria bacterium GWF2_35_9]
MENINLGLACLGIGIASLGGALGIGKLAAGAFEAMARQPEQSNAIRGSMIIAIAFVEASVLYSLIIAFIVITK